MIFLPPVTIIHLLAGVECRRILLDCYRQRPQKVRFSFGSEEEEIIISADLSDSDFDADCPLDDDFPTVSEDDQLSEANVAENVRTISEPSDNNGEGDRDEDSDGASDEDNLVSSTV